ncbi:hypothetical protein [Acaryochloris sp. CCMEE 5410]|uniref:hypothetical protein n=1 Tax=Acaryochloris sp. CCMEE 5410 TaxID=310037 RepID=UPI0002485152|nr:hypothetical protein [Acaryochloris sp. CCMEE 5410]KAI9130129.1 hypothetical protein ON05_031370 [Acaryochloris sp. CCMEE 5410]
MKTLQIEVDIDEDRQLTIQLPDDIELGKHQVTVVLNPQQHMDEPEGTNHQLNQLAGKIKSFAHLDAVGWQKQIRDEWDENRVPD